VDQRDDVFILKGVTFSDGEYVNLSDEANLKNANKKRDQLTRNSPNRGTSIKR